MADTSVVGSEPTRDQRAVLRAVYRSFAQTCTWPALADVDRTLRRRGVNAALVIRDMPQSLLRGGHLGIEPRPDTRLTLTLVGLTYCPGSADEITLFLRALRSLAGYEMRRGPSTMTEPVIVTSQELRRAWRLTRDQGSAFTRACQLLVVENWGGTGSEPYGDAQFEFRPSREIYRFRAVHSTADYLEAWRKWNAEQIGSAVRWEDVPATVVEEVAIPLANEGPVSKILKQWRPELEALVGELEPVLPAMKQALERIGQSFSGFWIGYHSRLYYRDFERPPLRAQFDSDWGTIFGTPDGWIERSTTDVAEAVVRFSSPAAGIATIEDRVRRLQQGVKHFNDELHLALPDALSAKQQKFTEQLDDLKFDDVRGQYVKSQSPSQFVSRDSVAMNQLPRVPAHLSYMGLQQEAAAVIEITRQALRYGGYLAALPIDAEPVAPVSPYVAESVRAVLTERGATSNWHIGKLMALIGQLNANYAEDNGYAAHMLLRSILDHVPPVLKQPHFGGVANNYGWGQTDKGYMKKLLEYKSHGDDALHRQISRQADTLGIDDLPPARYVNRLLQEIVSKL